jgi:FkbM family methyltransferase
MGAFLGYYAMWVAMQVGITGRVIAIEAVPEYCDVLRTNLDIFPQAEVLQVAVGSYKGKGTMYAGKRQTCGMRADVVSLFNESISEVEVAVDTADNILSDCDSIDMAIIQVNGAELDVLDGMVNTLPRVKNITIASQYNEENVNHLEVVSDILRDSGFEVCDDGVVVYGGRL